MRVIGGEYRSRLLKSLSGMDVRPTPDRLRETLFDVLAPRIQGVVFADLYAGTGAVGIEALSRGAARAIFAEHSRGAVRVIHDNLKSLGAEGRAEVRHARARSVIPQLHAEIVFLDPPYHLEGEYAAALDLLADRPAALVIAQHSSRMALNPQYGSLTRVRELKQGDNVLSFFEARHP